MKTGSVFVVLLRFSDNRSKAPQLMEAHNEWIKQGFEDGVFLLVGGLQPNQGGGIIAHGISLEELRSRINEDPFVAENIVTPEILEINPAKIVDKLKFLEGATT